MSDVQRILSAIEQGDPDSAGQLLPLIYDELRKLAAQKLAREQPGQTLQATALVHEAYARLVGNGAARAWNGRGHFFAAAATAMRHILVERARKKQRIIHGGGRRREDCIRTSSPRRCRTRSSSLWTRPWPDSPSVTRSRPGWSNCVTSRA